MTGFVTVVLFLLFLMMLGAAAVATSGLRRRVSALEREVGALRQPASDRAAPDEALPLVRARATTEEQQGPEASLPTSPVPMPRTRPEPAAPARPRSEPAAHARQPVEPDESSVSVTTSLGASLRAWFAGGNMIVRVAMLIVLAGVGFLVRLAAEQGWFPLELRLAAAALGGAACTCVGWRLHERRRGYALTLQGGGLAIVFIVTFAAFRLYGLIDAVPAFVMLAALAAGTAFVAHAQNALPLAVLGLAGAFLAPVLASTGRGNHVALFGWYSIVNLAVAWLATRRPWKLLNTLAMGTTATVALAWGASHWTPALLPTTEPFLLLHVALILFVTVQYARRLEGSTSGRVVAGDAAARAAGGATTTRLAIVDTGLLFGMPLVAFGMQAAMLRHVDHGIAVAAAGFAAVYLATARGLWYRRGEPLRLLTEGMLALGVVFLSLVAPYTFDGPWIAMAWSLQAAGMVWMALRQRRALALVLGQLLLVLSALALWVTAPRPDLVGSLVVGVAALASAWMLWRTGGGMEGPQARWRSLPPEGARPRFRSGRAPRTGLGGRLTLGADIVKGMHALSFGLALVCLLAGVWVHLHTLPLPQMARQQAMLLWPLLLALAFDGVRAPLRWPAAGLVSRVMAPLAAVAWAWLVAAMAAHGDAVELWRVYRDGGLATAAAMTAGTLWLMWRVQRPVARSARDEGSRQGEPTVVEVVAWGAPWLVHAAALAWCVVGAFVAPRGSWPATALMAAPLAAVVIMLAQQRRARWPFVLHAQAWRAWLAWPLLASGLVWSLVVNLTGDGAAHPLPTLPLVNPIDLMHVALAVVALRLARAAERDPARAPHVDTRVVSSAVAAAGFVWVSSMLVRALHHAAATPLWLDGALGSATVHTGLSVTWTLLALAAMALGTRRAWRTAWVVGAALLAVVVAKLLLVDMSQSGAALRIVSFLGVGVLMLVIGWLAPLPPPRVAGPAGERAA